MQRLEPFILNNSTNVKLLRSSRNQTNQRTRNQDIPDKVGFEKIRIKSCSPEPPSLTRRGGMGMGQSE
ncbi:MAG: hypothetical protein EA393_14830 [Bacteroidetes bacterium]|nr:MAG: hypothetical protein EA393_14830 [Bacteroidota bacterium]